MGSTSHQQPGESQILFRHVTRLASQRIRYREQRVYVPQRTVLELACLEYLQHPLAKGAVRIELVQQPGTSAFGRIALRAVLTRNLIEPLFDITIESGLGSGARRLSRALLQVKHDRRTVLAIDYDRARTVAIEQIFTHRIAIEPNELIVDLPSRTCAGCVNGLAVSPDYLYSPLLGIFATPFEGGLAEFFSPGKFEDVLEIG